MYIWQLFVCSLIMFFEEDADASVTLRQLIRTTDGARTHRTADRGRRTTVERTTGRTDRHMTATATTGHVWVRRIEYG